jgi:hypothetical protein
VPVSAQADDRWRLTDPNIEQVWSEFLRPTATLLARMIEEHPGGLDRDLGDLAVVVGVMPGIASKALDRLHRFEEVHRHAERSIVGVSGFAPSVSGGRVLRLSDQQPVGAWSPCRRVGGGEVGAVASGCTGGCKSAVAASCLSGAGAGAVRAARAMSGRRAGSAASPDRVSSEVGPGGSCAEVAGGHTPLQVPLRGTRCIVVGHRTAALSGRVRSRRSCV